MGCCFSSYDDEGYGKSHARSSRYYDEDAYRYAEAEREYYGGPSYPLGNHRRAAAPARRQTRRARSPDRHFRPKYDSYDDSYILTPHQGNWI